VNVNVNSPPLKYTFISPSGLYYRVDPHGGAPLNLHYGGKNDDVTYWSCIGYLKCILVPHVLLLLLDSKLTGNKSCLVGRY